MDRYTKRIEDGHAVVDCEKCKEETKKYGFEYCSVLYCRNRLKDRVADYEDTGLEPHEIKRIVDEYGHCHTLRTSSAERLEIIREIPTERLRELVEADRDGRAVVLPCKVGDELFYDYDCGVEKETVEKIVVEIETDCGIYNPEDIGESVYLTIEAAESALKGEQDEKMQRTKT